MKINYRLVLNSSDIVEEKKAASGVKCFLVAARLIWHIFLNFMMRQSLFNG